MQPDVNATRASRSYASVRAPQRGWQRFALAFGFASALACVPARAAPLDAKIVGQEALAPKWVYLRGGVAGLCPDILAAIERVEPRLHFVGNRQSRSLPGIEFGLEDGTVEVACALIPSPRREAIAERVGPVVYEVRHRLAARANDPVEVRSVQELAHMGDLVVGQRGGVFAGKLKAAGVQVDDATDDNGVNLRKVLAGHGRFVEMNELTMQHYLNSGKIDGRLRLLPVVMGVEPAYFWVSRKADPAIARLLGPALDKLKASGELERIYARHAADP